MYFEANGKRFKKFIFKDEIDKIVGQLATQINNDYEGQSVLFIVVLKGSIFFASDLLRQINLDCEIETVRASSYGKKMTGSDVRLCIDKLDIKDRNVIVIEDIVDTGNTLLKLMNKLKDESPASLKAVSFLSKPDSKNVDVNVKYIGKEIPSLFVIGYGLDYAEKGRHLPEIYILDE